MLASNNNWPGEGDITSLRQISTHPPPSKVGFFVLFCCFVHWLSENKEAALAVSVFVFSLEIWSWFWAALKIDRAILSYLISHYYTVRSDDVKVLKSRWNFVKTKTTTPGNNIYTLLITFITFTSFISSKFQTLFFPFKNSYYAWATCAFNWK